MPGKNKNPNGSGSNSLSRRDFLKSVSASAVAAAATQAEHLAAQIKEINDEKIAGPEGAPITLNINGEKRHLVLEPRVTLLDSMGL